MSRPLHPVSRPAPSGVGGGGCGELGQGELECVRPDGSEERILMPKLRPTPRPPALSPEVEEIPVGVRRLAAWSWRLIVIVAASALLLWGLLQLTVIVIPVLIAVLLTVLLTPIVNVLTKYTFLGRGAASFLALVGLLLVIAGMFTLAGRQLIAQWPDIRSEEHTSELQSRGHLVCR